MSDPLIEFHCAEGLEGQPFPQPVAATQNMPQWVKQMPAQIPGGQGTAWLTAKKCPPFIDALTGGYLVPLVCDVHFTMGANALEYRSSLPIVKTHELRQLKGTPFEGLVTVKFLNPWIIKTPPGYSCLFLQPLNRLDMPFYVVSGVVETDTYYNEINFPAVSMMRPGTTFTLTRGAPIVQVFPFKREAWTSATAVADDRLREPWESLGEGAGHYKEHFWQRKPYE